MMWYVLAKKEHSTIAHALEDSVLTSQTYQELDLVIWRQLLPVCVHVVHRSESALVEFPFHQRELSSHFPKLNRLHQHNLSPFF